MKKVAIVQSNYIPWKGYFDLIAAVDEFILFDDMQYTRRDWRNRNRIKTPNGLQWLTIPVQVKGKFTQAINQTEIADPGWAVNHWKTIELNYRKAAFFEQISAWLKPLYLNNRDTILSVVNRRFIEAICEFLNIDTRLSDSSEFDASEGKTTRLVELCKQARADYYVSGPSAKNYINESEFETADIGLNWFDYSDYPVYSQLWGEFCHEVTVLDLLFNCGSDAPLYMKHVAS